MGDSWPYWWNYGYATFGLHPPLKAPYYAKVVIWYTDLGRTSRRGACDIGGIARRERRVDPDDHGRYEYEEHPHVYGLSPPIAPHQPATLPELSRRDVCGRASLSLAISAIAALRKSSR
jgi:hypothetical protein